MLLFKMVRTILYHLLLTLSIVNGLTWKNHSEAMYTEHALVAQVRGARDLEEGKGWEKPSLRGGLLGE